MTLYYCIHDVLSQVENSQDENRFQKLIPVSSVMPKNTGNTESIFVLESSPNLLDLTQDKGIHQLASLIEEVPLYNINMELTLDRALCERYQNAYIMKALETAFHPQAMPSTLEIDSGTEYSYGNLRHPMISHISEEELSKLYVSFLTALGDKSEDYKFENSITGKHDSRFLELFDGFVTHHYGKIKSLILIAFGVRKDSDLGKSADSCIKSGKTAARKMNISEERELIWAWLEAEQYQAQRCHDIHRVMQIEGLPRIPNWVHYDFLACLEKEAMKQFFAHTLVHQDAALRVLDHSPLLKQAILLNAQNGICPALEPLIQMRTADRKSYARAALSFVKSAKERAAEAQKSGLGV